jgi:hypothetical protein
MAKKKMAKPTIKKAHKIARSIKRSRSKVDNPWAVGTAVAKKAAAKRKRARAAAKKR